MLRGPAGLAVSSCGIRLTPLEGSDRQLNAKSKPLDGLYTDTDPDDRSEIITDVTIRMPGKAGTMMMEVKVDPGAQPSCIPLHKFKTLFPHLCRDGLPKEGLLDNT